TYDHRILRTRLPVRSAIYKQDTGGLVLQWVTMGEYLLLYVFVVFFVKFLCGFWCAGNFVSRATEYTHSAFQSFKVARKLASWSRSTMLGSEEPG
ncbi:hypothetical protein CC80DRAFT_427211, partial [Byssothecium circinans]